MTLFYTDRSRLLSRNIFFPMRNHLASLMLTFAVFAVGFLFRPIGGILFSHVGDTRSRSKALRISIVLMCLPTILLGLVPDYSHIGIVCPILVVIIRLLQGLSVGGGYAGSMSYLTEIAPPNERGLYGSFVQIGLFSGILIGPLVIKSVLYFMTAQQFSDWGWRIPFVFGIVLGLVGYFLCSAIADAKVIQESIQHKAQKIPLLLCIKNYKKPLLIAFLISAQVGIPFWLVMVYSVTYFSKILHAPFGIVETQNMFAILIALITAPLIGQLTKIVSDWSILIISSAAFIMLSYIINIVLVYETMSVVFYIFYFLIVVFTASYLAAFASFISALFPAEVRYTGIALSYNVSLAIFGGFSPLVVTSFIKAGVIYAPGIMLTLSGTLAFITLLFSRKFARY